MSLRSTLILGAVAFTCAGCGGDDGVGNGSATFVIDAEDSITKGLTAGDGVEDIADGWEVTFDRYLAAIGFIEIRLATDEGVTRSIDEAYVIDLAKVGSQGLPLFELDGLSASTWEIFYETPMASESGVEAHESVDAADFEAMVEAEATYLIAGTIEKDDGVSCPPNALANVPDGAQANGENDGGDPCYDNASVSFEFLVPAETVFGPCEADDMPGFSVPEGGNQGVDLTIHGDHMFFNGFPEGAEGGIVRLAQWLADSDLNLDGEVTQAELEQISESDLSALDGYNPRPDFGEDFEDRSMWTWLRAQLKTQGHFYGEGECEFDGLAHDHGDDDDHADHE